MRRRPASLLPTGEPPEWLLSFGAPGEPYAAEAFTEWLRARAQWREQSDVPLRVMKPIDRMYAHHHPQGIPADLLEAERLAPRANPHRGLMS